MPGKEIYLISLERNSFVKVDLSEWQAGRRKKIPNFQAYRRARRNHSREVTAVLREYSWFQDRISKGLNS